MSDQDNQTEYRVVGILITTIILVLLASVLGYAVTRKSATSTPAHSTASPASTEALPDSRIEVLDGMVKFYFASGSAELAPGAQPTLVQALEAVAQGRRLLISGFHDETGDPSLNAELAKQRALSVQQALLDAGVPESTIELRKPEVMLGGDNMTEARRVELLIVD